MSIDYYKIMNLSVTESSHFNHNTIRSVVGIFWDIENCNVPKDRSLMQLIANVRCFISERNLREMEFVVVCDTQKCHNEMLDDLNNSQVTVVHVSGIAKNAADDKLKQLITRFIDIHTSKASLLVLTGDINFSVLLSDLRNRNGVHIILFHRHAAAGLLACADIIVDFNEFIKDLPLRNKSNVNTSDSILMVKNLPTDRKLGEIKKRLQQISYNCGGKVIKVNSKTAEAKLKFSCNSDAKRALQRINNEDVYGSKIEVVINDPLVNNSDIETSGGSTSPADTSPDESKISTNCQSNNITDYQKMYPRKEKRRDFNDRHNKISSPLRPYAPCVPLPYISSPSSSIPIKIKDSFSSVKLRGNLTKEPNKPLSGNNLTELIITNLDASLEKNDIEKILKKKFRNNGISFTRITLHNSQHSQRNSSSNPLYTKTDVTTYNWLKAVVQLPTQRDAQLAISKLQKEKIGFKRIWISVASEKQPVEVIRNEVISLFEDIPIKKIPLVTFQELFENRYHRPIGLGVIHKLRDVLYLINGETTGCNGNKGKYVMLNSRYRSSTLNHLEINDYLPYCTMHSNPVISSAWAEYLSINKVLIPMVNISLSTLSPRIHHLLDMHNGSFPLHSIVDCYEGEFHEPFNTSDLPLVALEHLITCVPGVAIIKYNNIKRITWLQNENKDCEQFSVNGKIDALSNKLAHFGKEVRELIKCQPHSIISFNRFVPTYHAHFGRQCVVSDMGFIKLCDLLEAIPSIVQIYGENNKRMITLTHREQTKRFASDLIKVLKAQIGRKITVTQFSAAYQELFEKVFVISDYGVCFLDDILKDVWEGTIIIKKLDSMDKLIELPKRDRSFEEIKRTKIFGSEIYQLLSTTPNFELTFTKVIPSYHHYFNKQCRVSDYGFSKLIELLEELSPGVIDIDFGSLYGERVIRLNAEKRLKALAHRLELAVKSFKTFSTTVSKLLKLYREEYGYNINLVDYNADSFVDLVSKMPNNLFRISQVNDDFIISLVDTKRMHLVALRAARILMEQSSAELRINELCDQYLSLHGEPLQSFIFCSEFKELFDVKQDSKIVKLSPLLMFARDCIQLMQKSYKDKFTLDDLEALLMEKFDRPLPQPYNYKCTSFVDLFRELCDYFTIEKRGKPGKFILLISLNDSLKKSPLYVREKEPPKFTILQRPDKKRSALTNNKKTICDKKDKIDLLCVNDIPSDLPLPVLKPRSYAADYDLISWSTSSSDETDLLSDDCPDLINFDMIAGKVYYTPMSWKKNGSNTSLNIDKELPHKKSNRMAADIFS